MNTIQIYQVTIRQDAEGRYCLNDLYKASGGLPKHKPSEWLRNKQTKELIAELNLEAGIPASNFSDSSDSGREFPPRKIYPVASVRGHGITATYVVKELVYAYAMWISPAFHLQVIRAYDAMVTGELNQHSNYWFRIRPHWLLIRDLVLQGKPYGEVANLLQRSVGSVRYAVKRMVEVGLINPAILARVQKGVARLSNLKRSQLWGQQLMLL